jgi:signal recognition particle GTPase
VLKSPTLDEQQLEEMLTEITNALVASDVELALAQQFRDAVRKDVDFQNQPAGINKRRVIQSVRDKEENTAEDRLQHQKKRPSWLSLSFLSLDNSL